jgi:hypothetical protein
MNRHIDQLKELTEAARLAGTLSSGNGRYARTPDYTRPAARSSRPRSDRGTTFHFSHKAMSKRNDVSDANFTHTTSAAHQGYIERPSATEEITPEIASVIKDSPMGDVEQDLVAPSFSYPARVVDPTRASFGTLGNTKAERKEFWNEVERNEGTNGRVQNRIIAELPVEFSLTERCMAARDFCQVLEERSLPYWATIHAPGKRNDKRNFHLHVTYFDRPSGRDSAGRWAHSVVETRRKKSRHLVKTRPYRSNKHPDTRARDWPKRLRRNYSDTCNFHLSLGDYEKRYDPRAYSESGITKEPTEHLGNKISAIESMGLDTMSGQRNAKREIRWKIAQSEEPWRQRQEKLVSSEVFRSPQLEPQRDDLLKVISEGTKHARKSASLSIISEIIDTRIDSRQTFLEEEVKRLSQKDDMSDLANRSAAIVALTSEKSLLTERAPSLRKTAKKCSKLGIEEMKFSKAKMKQFDATMLLIDPENLFDEDELSSLDDFDEITPQEDEVEGLDHNDFSNIDDLFSEDDVQEDIHAALTKDDEITEQDLASSEERKEDDSHERGDTASGPKEAANNKPDPLKSFASIQEIINDISKQDGAHVEKDSDKIDRDAFPGAWSVQPTRKREELEHLDQELSKLDNRELRQAAIASRDATDLCPAGETRDEFGRGWAVLRYESERRGLDLDTGRHDPKQATDPDRARLHVDQDPCPIRVVRKNIARQRVRG